MNVFFVAVFHKGGLTGYTFGGDFHWYGSRFIGMVSKHQGAGGEVLVQDQKSGTV